MGYQIGADQQYKIGDSVIAALGALSTGKSKGDAERTYRFVPAVLPDDSTVNLFTEQIRALNFFELGPGDNVVLLCVGMRNGFPNWQVMGEPAEEAEA